MAKSFYSSILLSFVLLLFACTNIKSQKLLIAGSGSDSIAILDKQSKTIEYSFPIPNHGECNSAILTDEGNILFSYSRGARLVNLEGEIIWDYPKDSANQEIQSALQIGDGYMLAVCGFPAKFIFLDKSGNKSHEIEYDTQIRERHSQFRQVRIAKNGNILIPLMGTGNVVELDKNGNIVNKFRAGNSLFSIEELENGNLLVSGGFGVSEFDRSTGSEVCSILKDSLQGVKFAFSTQSQRLSNGHTILSNWQGHEKNANQAQLVEISSSGDELWIYEDRTTIRYISSVYYFEK